MTLPKVKVKLSPNHYTGRNQLDGVYVHNPYSYILEIDVRRKNFRRAKSYTIKLPYKTYSELEKKVVRRHNGKK